MRKLPRGTVTFLFTDVEGSTRLLLELGPEGYAESLAEHRRIIRQACAHKGGVEVDTQGDAFFVAFSDADRAVDAADMIRTSLEPGPMRVRIGLHTGRPHVGEDGYIGEDVHLGARIAASGHGGQILLSQVTRDAIDRSVGVIDLGEHRLKDFRHAVAIYQLGTDPFPPLKTISNTNFPHPTDSFVGRESEIVDIVARVRAGNRLLTLTGPGGSGKTRLAIEAAATLPTNFRAGVFWVDLSAVRDPAEVSRAVAATLTTEQDLEAHIGERDMLLVLDNFEQVIDAAPWVSSMVASCRNLSVIVTSRERLRVRGESLLEVPPLGPTESGQLFVDRARVDRSAEIDELCARLEHVPLAVELAAARIPALTPRQILERLGQRLDLLKGGRDADPRQRTLRATIDWSHSLLRPNEQRLFRRLAVFAGGATLDGIEAVCDAHLDTIESLSDKSLVRSSHGRYSMLETVREHAAEKLEASGERADVRARHAEFVGGLMADQIPALTAGGDNTLGPSLAAEFGNLQAAFAWLVESGDAPAAAGLIDTVWWFVSGFLSQNRAGLAMCDAVLAMSSLTDADRMIVWHREGNFAVGSDRDRGRRAWVDAAAVADRLGDAAREADVTGNLSAIETDAAEAVRLFERSLALAPAKYERAAYKRQWNLAGMKRRAGDVVAAEAITTEVIARANRVGDYEYVAAGEGEMGEMALDRGDIRGALDWATRSGDLAAAHGHAVMTLIAEELRCRAAARLGLHDEAIRSLAKVMDLLGRGDLDADEEIEEMVLCAAVEMFAAIGEVAIASKLEAPRRRLVDRRPWILPAAQASHDGWLASNGVLVTDEWADLDVQVAMAAIREWLDHCQTDAIATSGADASATEPCDPPSY